MRSGLRPGLRSCLLACFLAVAASASAQTIWRCGADGRSFSQTPCVDGQPMQPGRTPRMQDLAPALEQAAREQALAETLAQQRRQRAALAKGAAVGFYGNGEPDALRPKMSREPTRPKGSKRTPKPFAATGTSPATVPVSPRRPG